MPTLGNTHRYGIVRLRALAASACGFWLALTLALVLAPALIAAPADATPSNPLDGSYPDPLDGADPSSADDPAAATWFVNDDVNDGLAGHWKFDEVGAATAHDFAGTEHVTLQNGAAIISSTLPTVLFPDSGALSLDGVDDQVAISNTGALNLATSFSVAGWLKRSSINHYDAIYDSGDQADQWWVFVADGSSGKDNKLGFGERSIAEHYSTQAITDNNWHHFAVVKNGNSGTNLFFYVDGAARGSAGIGSLNTPFGIKYVGVLSDTIFAAHFHGNLDDVRLYNRALSAAEVAHLAAGHGCVFDGTSWPTAMRELQCALSEAVTGDDIHVANGTYRPGVDRALSFNLKNGVNVFGDYTANPGLPNERSVFDPLNPPTVLLGDIDGDDNPATHGNYGDNTRQVLTAPPNATLTLDGFGVRGGNADGPLTQTTHFGGGLFAGAGANLRLNQLAFLSNQSAGDGAGVFSQSTMDISGTTFISNSSSNSGGGLAITASVRLTNSDFLSNSADFGGAANTGGPATVFGGTFRSNRATHFDGGAIYALAALDLEGPITFTQNFAGFSGGAIAVAGPFSVTTGTFLSNTASVFSGGAVEALDAALVQVSTFRGNRAEQTGGALSVSGPAAIFSGDFRGNQVLGGNCSPACSVGDGGAIAAFGPLTITASTLQTNTARLRGGAIFANHGLLVTSSSIDANSAGQVGDAANPARGGGIYAAEGLTLTASDLSNNHATDQGGGLHVSGVVSISHASVSANTAITGGGLSLSGGGVVASTIISGNTAAHDAGGMVQDGGDLMVSGVTFQRNQAQGESMLFAPASGAVGFGGGFEQLTGTTSIDGSTFDHNTAQRGGGAHFRQAATLSGSTFLANSISGAPGGNSRGGGVLAFGALTAMGNLFNANGAETDGGGLFVGGFYCGSNNIYELNTSGATGGGLALSGGGALAGEQFLSNGAGTQGGALQNGGSLTVTHSVFSNNHAPSAGAIGHTAGVLRLAGSLFIDNTAGDPDGSGVVDVSGADLQMVNDTLAGTAGNVHAAVQATAANVAVTNTIFANYSKSLRIDMSTELAYDFDDFSNTSLPNAGSDGGHNLTANPLFVFTALGNFRLRPGSPLLDAGRDGAVPPFLTTDLDGGRRIVDVPGAGVVIGGVTQKVDIGAHEYVPPMLYLPAILR